jgi:hypothetical protein
MKTAIVYDNDGSIFKVINSLILLRIGDVIWFNKKSYKVSITTFEIDTEVLNVIVVDM